MDIQPKLADHSVIDALALGRHWRFWLKGGGGGGGGRKILGIKGGGGRLQMVDHKKCRYINFELKL